MKNKNFLGMWVPIGVSIGTALGVAIQNIGVGIGTGLLLTLRRACWRKEKI
ncbi:glycine zipper family protein [Mongoliibacter ruber]|uniref:Glycine zipper-like domain-containing protein n=1 Tax=Mongoliibacter ruber TaxID=1750599 RepID=A0A2T0WEH6_9BACT|nr:glycine zipper family protein [Mongoliibacter ruber]PRY85119.1 hypothetical protein CLW00_11426 [Mongoliibacter ruber]